MFVRLYERYHDEVHAFCMRRVGPASTDDVVSEVFTVVWRSIDRVDLEAERAWVYGVARNVIRNQWRADRRWRNLKEKVFWMHEPSPPQPDGLSMAEVKRAEVLEAVRSLTLKDREILMLSGWDDLSGPEIAKVLGISVSAAQQRLHRAKKRLANEMSRVRPSVDDESEAAS